MDKKERSEYFSKVGKKGGKTTAKKYGPEHMREIAKRGWQAGIGKKYAKAK